MNKDPRTPSTYFKKAGIKESEINHTVKELNEMIDLSNAINSDPSVSSATKDIVKYDIKKMEKARYKKLSRIYAHLVVDAMINGSVYDVVASMNNALVHKISNKIKPDQMKNGQEVEEQLFWTDIIGNK